MTDVLLVQRTQAVTLRTVRLLRALRTSVSLPVNAGRAVDLALNDLTELHTAASREVVAAAGAPSADASRTLGMFLYTGYECSVCKQPQYTTPSGDVCVNLHGGADPGSNSYAHLAGTPVRGEHRA